MARLSVTVIETASAFAGLRDEWNALVRECGKSPFSTHEWLSTYWTHYGESSRLCVFLVRSDEGRLVGACPLQVRTMGVAGMVSVSRAVLLGAPLTDMQDILFCPGHEEQVIDQLTESLVEHRIDFLDLPEVPEDSPLRLLGNRSRPLNLLIERPMSRLPFVTLPGSWAEFLATRGTSTQRNVKYYGNRLSKKYCVEFTAMTNPEDIERALLVFFDLYAKRFAEYPLLTSSTYRAFRKEMALLFAKNGWLILFTLALDGQIVAAELCLKNDQTIYAYNSCYDPEWSREGTTLIMQARILEYAISQRFQEYNFLRGEESYKEHWATGTRQQYAVHLSRPSWKVQLVERSRGFRHLLSNIFMGARSGRR
ncbi:MAG: GNAT family N-acetyltransferase [Nitrospira sp.]|jgi:CelD/BcsL family acetyltransferase involved in cellulose biosynthesis